VKYKANDTYNNHSEEDLVLFVQQGDISAFSEIYSRYWDKLYNAAYKRLPNSEACEEIVQDVFIKYWEKSKQIVFTTNLSAYLFTAIRYNVIDYYRKETVKDTFIKASRFDTPVDNSNEEHIQLKDLMHLVSKVIESLPSKCRTVYQLSRIEHKSNKEISAELNISEKTVEGHLTKALQYFRLYINDLSIVLLFFTLK
jgi:RNA polymerase sigma-70 factor (ECF subfamily)